MEIQGDRQSISSREYNGEYKAIMDQDRQTDRQAITPMSRNTSKSVKLDGKCFKAALRKKKKKFNLLQALIPVTKRLIWLACCPVPKPKSHMLGFIILAPHFQVPNSVYLLIFFFFLKREPGSSSRGSVVNESN